MIGIYCIENTVNNKKYIGYSQDIEQRWKDHRWALNRGNHINKWLQASWKKYGQEAFIFYVLEECDKDKLKEREIYYISYYDSYRNGYNLTTGGDGSHGRIITDEMREKMGSANRGKEYSKEKCNQMSIARKGEKGYWYGKHLSEETKNKISQSKIKNESHRYGKNSHAKKVMCDGVEYDCAQRCADYYHINDETLRSWLRGNRPMPQRFIDMGLCFI